MRKWLTAVTVLAILMALVPSPGAGAAPAGSPVIVTIVDGVEPAAAAARFGIVPTVVFEHAINGYAATLSSTTLQKVRRDRSTVGIEPDAATFSIDAQAVSLAVRRVGGLNSPTANIDGVDERIDVDVAVIDTGIYPHQDLNLVGGVNCAGGNPNNYADANGHGTMVAGLIAGIDNDFGQVGVAPGARIWAVRVTGNGAISNSRLLCALDWVLDNAETIDVVNMSLGGRVNAELVSCANAVKKPQAVRAAICSVYDAGIVMTASAGNESRDASAYEPARMHEVIAVSAIGDSDGQSGGLGPLVGNCFNDPDLLRPDDSFALFSNFGEPIDLAAPGVCVASTYNTGGYAVGSGTSFSAPLVAGAAGLYLANHPGATPDEVRSALLSMAEPGPIPGDPDSYPEGVLNVAGL